MKSSQILFIIAAFALAGQAAGIGQVSAWDIVKKHERMAREMSAGNSGIAKANPYGTPYMGNDWEFGDGMEFWDATSLLNVEQYTRELYMTTVNGREWLPDYHSFVISRNKNGLSTQIAKCNPDTASRTIFYYSSNGLCTLAISQDRNSTWTNRDKNVVEYNNLGQPVSVAFSQWDTYAEVWRDEWPSELSLFFYSNSGLLDSVFVTYRRVSGTLDYDTIRYAYGIDGKVSGSIKISSQGYTILGSVNYPSGTTQVYTSKILNAPGEAWQNHDSIITEYDIEGRQINFSQFIWYPELSQYAIYKYLEMEYDSSGRIHSFICKRNYGSGELTDKERGTYKYTNSSGLKYCPAATEKASSYRISANGPVIALQTSKSNVSEISFMDAQGKKLETCFMHGILKWTAPASGIYLISAKANDHIENFQIAVTK